MGALADVLAQKKTFATGSPLANWLNSEIAKRVDAAVPTAYAVTDAVHSLATSTMTSGNFTLTFTLRNGETFTTGNILFSAAAATIETAIDNAATSASITGWTNGDITVSGGAVNANPVVFTFDGDSVSGTNHPITVLTDVDGAGGAWGAITITTAGQSVRNAWAVLENLGVISGTPPAQTAAASLTSVTRGANLIHLPDVIIKALMRECAAEDDNNGSYFSLQAALYPQDRAPLVPTRLVSDNL